MLNINKNQFEVMAIDSSLNFNKKIDVFIRNNFSSASSFDDESMGRAILRQVAQAKKYDLYTERQILTYVVTAWIMGENFDEKMPAAVTVLNNKNYMAEEKREWLSDWVVELLLRLSPNYDFSFFV